MNPTEATRYPWAIWQYQHPTTKLTQYQLKQNRETLDALQHQNRFDKTKTIIIRRWSTALFGTLAFGNIFFSPPNFIHERHRASVRVHNKQANKTRCWQLGLHQHVLQWCHQSEFSPEAHTYKHAACHSFRVFVCCYHVLLEKILLQKFRVWNSIFDLHHSFKYFQKMCSRPVYVIENKNKTFKSVIQ